MKKNNDFIPFSPPVIGEDDIEEVVACLRSGWLTTGPRVQEFQQMVAREAGVSHGVATSSCTMAMQVALMVMGVGPGHEVLTSPLTFASTAHVIKYLGAEPVFADVEESTFNLDPDQVRETISRNYQRQGKNLINRTTGRVLKALLPVHYGGHCCNMDPLMELAQEFGLLVLEDAAHAIGARYNGRPAGSLGHAACFSFYATKNISTAEGGMLVTNNEAWAEKAKCMTMYGISDARKIWGRYAPRGTWTYDVADLGLKCNLPDVLAALGISQMRKFESMQARRAENVSLYNELLADQPSLRLPCRQSYAGHAWHLYALRLIRPDLPEARDTLIEQLRERGIGTSVLFIPLHYHSYYRNMLGGATMGMFPVAEKIFQELINLPVSPGIGTEDIRYIAETILELTGKK